MAHLISPDRAAVGRERALEVRQSRASSRMVKAATVAAVVDEVGDLSPAALSAALDVVTRVARSIEDGLPIENWLDAKRAAEVAETVHRIARLAAGQSTSNIAHAAALTDEERAERMAYLRSLADQVPAEPSSVVTRSTLGGAGENGVSFAVTARGGD
jgi:hypothetical protein